MLAPLAEAITDGAASGEFTSEDPIADAKVIFHLVSSITADQAALGGTTPRDEIERMVVQFIDRALGVR
jgi:hypothetical protein